MNRIQRQTGSLRFVRVEAADRSHIDIQLSNGSIVDTGNQVYTCIAGLRGA